MTMDLTYLLVSVAFLLGFVALILLLVIGLSDQGWIALDQYLSCRLNQRAMADETYSAMCWRKRSDGKEWADRVKAIDKAFLILRGQEDHCRKAYESELLRTQLPKEYSNG